MGVFNYLLVLWLLEGASMSWAAMHDHHQKNVQTQCSFTRYPDLCVQSLMESKVHPVDFKSALVNKTIAETNLRDSYFAIESSELGIHDAQHAISVTSYCKELMKMSLKRLHQSSVALKDSPRKNKHDIQTWLSAALTYQEACKDSASSLGLASGDLISRKMDYLSGLASNPLALVNRITGINSNEENVTKNGQLGEEQDFPKWVSAKDRKLLQSTTIRANAVVAKDGTGNYRTVAEAIRAASGNRFVIHVKAGVYKEKICTNKHGITLIGEGKYSTIITGDASVNGGSSMPGSATFTITGDRFIAMDIGFQNTAGPEEEQALALYVASDKSVFYHCSLSGYQDTLYAMALSQFYRECDIHGTIDFIFGNAAAVFQTCNLVLRRPRHGAYNTILANGRTDPGQNTGFSLQNCRIMASSDFSAVKHNYASFLGRPWKQYSRAVIMQWSIDDAIALKGWIEWPGQSYAKSLYFAEYSNTGPGSRTSSWVSWPGFHVIEASEAVKFTVGNFIFGSSWIPSTGVTFVIGLQ